MTTVTHTLTSTAELAHLQALLDGWQHTPADVSALSAWVQTGCPGLRTDLPPKYIAFLQDVVSRLESSALFAEESCSFSQRDLLDNLRIWAAKAADALA